jgi:FAD/FMN-containing dehydrogenase
MLNAVDESFETRLRGLLDDTAFRPDKAPYLTEPRGRYQGQGLVVAPADTAAVAALVAACAAARVGIVPYGGGTGLVGGQVMPDGPAPVILSLERLNRLRGIYPSENVLVCEAGMILAHVQEAAADVDRLFPLSLASEGSARIGGLLATNAGGVNVLRYGNARALCLGVEVVRPDGTIWHGLTRLRKDNTGYDLRDLMIGSEGTLGIITAAALRLVPRPKVQAAALMAVASPAAALDLLALAGAQIGDGLQAFELIHRQGFDFLAEVGPDLRQPMDTIPDWAVLIDLGLTQGDAEAALSDLFAAAFDAGLVDDGVIATSGAQRQALWDIRENIPEANRRIGAILSNDIALPLGHVPAFIDRAGAALRAIADLRINCFGHLGDGNLHYNLFPAKGRARADYDAARPALQRIINDLVHELEGSISAEHGIGRLKTDDLARYGDPAKLAMLRAIKTALDPLGIMNPGAVLPQG